MDKIDTPRTDAEEFTVDDGMEWDGKSVSADFARTLERELSQALARVAELEGALLLLADDHEFGATGTIRQDHLATARAALSKAKES